MAQIHVITGPERRRHWSDEQKQALVATAFAPGAVVREVARQADVCTSLIYRWRREYRIERSGFAEMVVVPTGPGDDRSSGAVVEIEFEGKVRVRIAASTRPELAVAIVRALARR